MTLPQVKQALGRHDTGWSEQRGLGRRCLELTWDGGPDDYFAVGLLGRPGALRVVSVATTPPAEQLRGLRCQTVWSGAGGTLIQTEYSLGRRNGRQTVFVPGKWRFYRSNPSGRVAYVTVRPPAP
jgi:hypothetical protein